MFEITKTADGTIELDGRFDASQEDAARAVLDEISSSVVVDFGALKYISSAGLGILLRVQKRLMGQGDSMSIVNLSPHIREIFEMAGFDRIFKLD